MEGRGGCCIARYAGGGGSAYGYYHDVSNVDRIRMRFRPIAPKPTSGEPVSPAASVAEPPGKTRRGKRRYTTKNGGCTRNYKKRKAASGGTTGSSGSGSWSGYGGESDAIVTLPLLPDTPVEHVQVGNTPDPCVPQNAAVGAEVVMGPTWLCFGRGRKMETWVVVECVTETWVEEGLGGTDEERRVGLGRDACPGFESDGAGRVRWTNEAYGRMVGQGEGEVIVWLEMKERVRAMLMYLTAFTCRVRMHYGSGKEMRSMTVPCDAWRMDSGGFVWRLDVKAALTLSSLTTQASPN